MFYYAVCLCFAVGTFYFLYRAFGPFMIEVEGKDERKRSGEEY